MKIIFDTRRPDGSHRGVTILRSNGALVDLIFGWNPKGRGVTQGQRDAIVAAEAVFRRYSQPFTGDLAAVSSLLSSTGHHPYMLVETTGGEIGGMRVDQPGYYLIRDGRILRADAGPLDEGSTHDLDIVVGGIVVAVEMYDDARDLDDGMIVEKSPIPLGDWPLSAAEIQRRAQEAFDSTGCRARRDDAEWAVREASERYRNEQARYSFRPVPTAERAAAIRRNAYDEAGLCR